VVTALFIGRFQPFHKGHMHALEYIAQKNERIIIGIGSANSEQTITNPFTLSERRHMIMRALETFQTPFELVPIDDVHDLAKWRALVSALRFGSVYSNNEFVVRALYRSHDVERIPRMVKANGSEIRRRIIQNDPSWQEFVPVAVRDYLISIGVGARLRELFSKE